ncbi:MAG: uracil-DNA glycosylase [Kiritimatiellales bacterium]|nr:uracil-DNA glycosylase [Kiritimatiellales bacterium]MCF7863540.1 uracil-DNA glycosylase [Kiritimatiellales bacterium]
MAETTFHSLVENLEKYLEYQRDEGVQRLDVDRAVLAALAKEPEPELRAAPEAPVMATVPMTENFKTLEEIATHVSACRRCPLCQGRTHSVPGEGNADSPDLMFIGEGPGADEDAQGRPFVGKAGQLLTKMIEAMGYARADVFIANVVKCRPPNNRTPLPEEMDLCLPYLRQQIGLIKPKVIVGLGATAIKGLLGKTVGVTRLRGTWQEYEGIKLMPTFHPSYLLRDPSKKKEVWQDLLLVLKELGKEPPPRK